MYYFLERIDDPAFGVGYTSEDYSFDVISEGNYYDDWDIVSFHLREGGFADYQTNDLDWPLCSTKLKTIIEGIATPFDHIQWLPASVINGNGEEREYYILHLPVRVDALDRRKSTFATDDLVITPYFDIRAITGHEVFSFPGGEFSVIVSEKVRNTIVISGCRGIDFTKADCG